MTILETALAVLIGIVTRDVANNLYYEGRYILRKKFHPRDYKFSLENLKEEEN
jgi:hypothetical protein